MKFWIACGVLGLLLAGCAVPPPRPAEAVATPGSVDELAAAIKADADGSEHERDSSARRQLSIEASRDAEACMAQAPRAAACLYGRALALGLEAREHPTRVGELLNSMLAALTDAEAVDPEYDEAGPARVRALVLIRAPGWPLGPGDSDEGLVAARRAVALRPVYPPNLLALAEAEAKTGDPQASQQSYARARDAAQALPSSTERDDWVLQADQGLKRE